VKRRDIETGEPHIAYEDDLEGVIGFLEAGGEFLTLLLVANVGLPVERIRGRTVMTIFMTP